VSYPLVTLDEPADVGTTNTKGYNIMSTSSIVLVGNLTKDPVLRFSPNGTATASLSIAVNRKLFRTANTANGPNPAAPAPVTQETVSFYNVVAWQSLAENVCESLHKGDRVVVTGRLDQRSWVTKEAERRVTYEIIAEEVAPSLRWVGAELKKPIRTDRFDVPLHSAPEAGGELVLAGAVGDPF
jgi:single-strand DNA-binding protein